MTDDLLTASGLSIALQALAVQSSETTSLHDVELRSDRLLVTYFINDDEVSTWRVLLHTIFHTRPFGFCEFEVCPGGRITFLNTREASIQDNDIPLRWINAQAIEDLVARVRSLLGRPNARVVVTFTRGNPRSDDGSDARVHLRVSRHASPGTSEAYSCEDDADDDFEVTATLTGEILPDA